ncbi:hypothetical protein ACFFHH_21145 [Cytobacillus solani]
MEIWRNFSICNSIIAGAVQFLYGNWTILLTILLVLAILDFISGMAAGFV